MIGDLVRTLVGVEQRRAVYDPASSALRSLAPTVAGTVVTVDSAMRNMTVLRCVGIISQTLASMPLVLYKRDGRNRSRATDHALYPVLSSVGNSEMTAFEVRETRLAHTLTYGNAFAQIQYDSAYQVRGLLPMVPDRVGIERLDTGKLVYTYWDDNTRQGYVLPSYRVMHTRYTVWRNVWGMSPIRQAMNALGVATAAEEFGGRYFANGSRPSIILKYPGRLQPDAYKRLRESFSANWEGLENVHRINILEEGITPEQIGIPPDEAQFLETRQYQVQEIARLYGVPLHMLAVGETATFASSEQDAINFRQFTILPWARRDESRLGADLLTARERNDGYYIEYLLDGIERATIETRSQAYSTLIQTGVMTPNEGRERENLDPLPGGDVLLLPLNMQQIRPDGTVVAPDSPPAVDTPTRDELRPLVAAWITDVQRRLTARIANDVRQAGAKALRQGGRLALSEWGEGMQVEWRQAGQEMLAPLATVQPGHMQDTQTVAGWVAKAYQDAVRELIA
jgi:HK97 family phage portal protein